MATQPTPTTYALLGLLAVRPWSAYELVGQIGRSLHYFWPRSEAHVYAEAKRLVRLGFARADTEANGKRTRTVYAITDTGRASLREWLRTEPAPPQIEIEALLRLMFADHGSADDLLAALRSTRAAVDATKRKGMAQIRDYLETGGPFPQRLHIIALMTSFYVDFLDLVSRWTRLAEAEAEGWPDTADIGLTTGTRALLEKILAEDERM